MSPYIRMNFGIAINAAPMNTISHGFDTNQGNTSRAMPQTSGIGADWRLP